MVKKEPVEFQDMHQSFLRFLSQNRAFFVEQAIRVILIDDDDKDQDTEAAYDDTNLDAEGITEDDRPHSSTGHHRTNTHPGGGGSRMLTRQLRQEHQRSRQRQLRKWLVEFVGQLVSATNRRRSHTTTTTTTITTNQRVDDEILVLDDDDEECAETVKTSHEASKSIGHDGQATLERAMCSHYRVHSLEQLALEFGDAAGCSIAELVEQASTNIRSGGSGGTNACQVVYLQALLEPHQFEQQQKMSGASLASVRSRLVELVHQCPLLGDLGAHIGWPACYAEWRRAKGDTAAATSAWPELRELVFFKTDSCFNLPIFVMPRNNS